MIQNSVYSNHSKLSYVEISDDAKDWVRSSMSPSARTRLKPEDALNHPWLTKPGMTIN